MPSAGAIWVPLTLGATVAQVLRTARQHELRQFLSATGAAYVRFLFAWPLALILGLMVWLRLPNEVDVTRNFWLWSGTAGVVQITGTILLLRAFRARDFAIGTVYSKAEVILVAVGSAVFLNEPLRALGWFGAAVVLLGVVLLAAPVGIESALQRWGDPSAWLGIGAGLFFALSAVAIRGATTSIVAASVWHRTCLTLLAILSSQALLHGAFLAITDSSQLVAIWKHRRKCLPVGLMSFAGTTGWVAAMAVANAAKVRTLGQIEIVLVFMISLIRLREPHPIRDYLGSGLVLSGVVLVVVLG
ncbi:MAG: EamA family transporter [Acidimicrobiales bacterium]|nr:EamA family transporter [Acidimicrobiales bacterium]